MPPSPTDPEPRWPALIADLAAAACYAALPAAIAPGPTWLVLIPIALLSAATLITHHRGLHLPNRVLGHALSALLTVYLVWSLALLVRAVPTHREPPPEMLRSAAALWFSNVLVFALWYWRLDGGGPHGRDASPGHTAGAFLFPQMTTEGLDASLAKGQLWSPRFVDYLFLAFNTSTAFSPTDVPVLSRWAKLLTMTQSAISLTTVVVLAARAVNIM